MRAYRWLVALVFMAGGLHAQTVGSLASSACPLGGCAQGGTGTVTTTSTLVSGRVALSSGASSLTDDGGCTWTGTGASFVLQASGFNIGGSTASGTLLSQIGGSGFIASAGDGSNFRGWLGDAFLSSNYGRFAFSSTGSPTGAVDLALSRASAGLLLVEDGSGNARDVQARTGTFGTSLVAPKFVSGPGKSGTNVAGTNNTIQAEPGTGSATGSSIIFQTPTATTSGTDAQTQATRLTLSEPAVVAAVPVRLAGYTVATLPAGTVGDTAYCTDLTTPTFMAVAVGGGAVVGKVFFDGTNWITQ